MAGSCVQAIYHFPKDASDDLELEAGDVIKVTSVVNDDWFFGISKTGVGQFPASYVETVFNKMPDSVCVAVADFLGEEEDDLTFNKGDVIGITEEVDSNWLRGYTKTSSGIFPKQFIEVLPFELNGGVDIEQERIAISETVDAYGIANEAFTAQSGDELSFPKGARIDLVQEIDSFWTLGIYKGSKGKFPSMFVNVIEDLPLHLKFSENEPETQLNNDQETKPQAKALFMYIGTSDQDLNFDKGEIILLKERIDDNWLKGQIGKSVGIFPANYVQVLIDLPFQNKKEQNGIHLPEEKKESKMKVQNAMQNGSMVTGTGRVERKGPSATILTVKSQKTEKGSSLKGLAPRPPLKPKPAPKPPVTTVKPDSGFPLKNDCITVIKADRVTQRKDDKKVKPSTSAQSSTIKTTVAPNRPPGSNSRPQIGRAADTSQPLAPGFHNVNKRTVIVAKKNDQDTIKARPAPPEAKAVTKKAQTLPVKRQAPTRPNSIVRANQPSGFASVPLSVGNDLLSGDNSAISQLPKPLAPQPPIKPSVLPLKTNVLPQSKSADHSPVVEAENYFVKSPSRVTFSDNDAEVNNPQLPQRKAFTPPPQRKTRPKSAYLQAEYSPTLKKSATLSRRNTTRSSKSSSKFFVDMAAAAKTATGDVSPAVDSDSDLGNLDIHISEVQNKISAEVNLLSGVETLLEVVTDESKVSDLKAKQSKHLAIIKELNDDLGDLEDEKSFILAKYGKVEDIMNRIVRVEQQIQMFKSKVEQLEQASDITSFEELAEMREDTEFCRCMVETLQEELVTLRERLLEKQKPLLTPEETKAKQLEQRNKVVNELLQTERDYVRDTTLCTEQVMAALRNVQTVTINCDTLFGNLAEVGLVSARLLEALEAAVIGSPNELGQALSKCFINLSTELKECYANYCKNYDDAQALSEKYEQDSIAREEVMNAMKLIRGESFTWDLPSYLIKPVQRILKYPLLLQEFLKNTPEDDSSRDDVALAINSMTEVATSINEFKRRKDLVQKYQRTEGFGDKMSKLNWHSVRKKSSRINQRLTQFTGLNSRTVDAQFNEEEKKVRSLEKLIKTLIKNVEAYIDASQEHASLHKVNVSNIFDFCEDLSPPPEVKQYISLSLNLVDVFNKHVTCIQNNVNDPLNKLLHIFQSPFRLMEKREDKLLDYDSLQKKVYRTKDRDKLKTVKDDLEKAKNDYQALNSQLLEDLPKLNEKCIRYIIVCLTNFITAHRLHSKEVNKYLSSLPQNAIPVDSSAILTVHTEAIQLAAAQLEKLTFSPDKVGTLTENRRSTSETVPSPSGTLGRTNFYIDFSVIENEVIEDPTSPIKPSQTLEPADEPLTLSDPPVPAVRRRSLRKTPSPSNPQEEGGKLPSLIDGDKYRVKYSFCAEDSAEISVNEGDIVRVVTKSDKSGNSEWWLIEANDNRGYVPSEYLEPMSTAEVDDLEQALFKGKQSLLSNEGNSEIKQDIAYLRNGNSFQSIDKTTVEATSANECLSMRVNADLSLPIGGALNAAENPSADKEGPQVAEFFVAEYDFEKSNPGELSLTEGQLVHVIKKHDCHGNAEWWLVEVDGSEGYVPGNYLSFVHSVALN